MHDRSGSRWIAYGIALVILVLALLFRWSLDDVLGERALYSTFFPAVLVAAFAGGFWPGMAFTIASALLANFILVEPYFSFGLKGPGDLVAVAMFVFTGAFISGLNESLLRAQRRILANERRRAEEALREIEERFRQLAENIDDVFWMTDERHERLLYVSPVYEEIWGRTCQSLYEHPGSWLENVHPDDRDAVSAGIRERVSGVFADQEFRIVRPDGTIRWVRSRAFPVVTEGLGVSRIAGLIEDISERKEAEAALRRASDRLELAVRGSNIGIWDLELVDGTFEHGRLSAVNLWEQLGYPADIQLDTASRIDIWHPDDRERVMRAVQACLDGTTKDFEVEYRLRHKDGTYRWRLHRGVAVRDEQGISTRFIGSSVDISIVKQVEEELRHAKEAAEAANLAKDEFLANVSHEIRTPMNAILGMTALTLETPLAEDQRRNLRTVESAAENLLGIINDLLDFSKIEAGKLELEVATFSLRSVVGDTLQALALQAHRKGLELLCDIAPEVPDALGGDPARLRQVLLNLLGNAIKFTAVGEVMLRVQLATPPGSDENVALQFSVTDTGIGIPADKQETIFRAFEQADMSTTRRFGGTGLGLAIASRLVALMGGRITVASDAGRGSTFTFKACFAQRSLPSGPAPASSPDLLRHLPVLIVDDNATNRLILDQWLRRWQMEPSAADSGERAIDLLLHAAEAGQAYPLVLLDARMPDIDGLTVAARIREQSALSATRILLLTSEDRPSDLARLRELRIDAWLLKPLRQEELLSTICRIVSLPLGSSAPVPENRQPTETPSAGEPLRILVAEDNDFNVQLLEQLLARRGHQVQVAMNGREALNLAAEGPFDLLLLDIHMPEMDGFQVIEALREREKSTGRHLPAVALTARSRREDRDRCLAAGMDDFLTKPIQANELWSAIGRLAISHSPKTPSPLPANAAHSHSILDARTLLAACGGDGQILNRLCEAFAAQLPGHLFSIRRAWESQDAPALREAAHKLCGMIAAFSSNAGRLVSELEDLAEASRLAECGPLVEELERQAAQIVRQLSGLTAEELQRQVAAGTG